MKYSDLWVCSLTPEQHRKTCGYWYTVIDRHMAHTAFARRESLMQWLEERGLSLTEPLPEHGTHGAQRIKGEYVCQLEGSYDAFYALPAIIETRTLDNGSYTMARITETDGIRTVHVLNCNNRHRPKYDYAESRAMMG